MIWECLEKLNEVDKRNKMTLLLVPVHTAVEGNETRDNRAKGTGTPFLELQPKNTKESNTEKNQFLRNFLRNEAKLKFL